MLARLRTARLFVSLSLVLALPGLAPYQATAQTLSARPGASAAASSAAGVAGNSLKAAAPSIQLSVPTFNSAAPLHILSAPAVTLPVLPEAGLPLPVEKNDPAACETSPAAQSLETVSSALSAEKEPGGTSSQVKLNALFSGETTNRAQNLPASIAEVSIPAFRPLPAAAAGPRWVFRDETPTPPSAPRSSLKRTLSVGFLAGFLSLVVSNAGLAAASHFGWVPHGNYSLPGAEGEPTIAGTCVLLAVVSVLAPIAEEIFFRAGLQGGLSKITSKLHLGSFLLPALVTSAYFISVHETADAVLIAARFVLAGTLSWVFKKEGLLASMATHSVFNGLQALPALFAALHAPILSLLMIPATAYAALKSWKTLKEQKQRILEGTLVYAPFTVKYALIFLPILAAGFFGLMPVSYWLYGILGLVGYLSVKAFAAASRRWSAPR